MKSAENTGFDIEIDELTNSIRNVVTGDSFSNSILPGIAGLVDSDTSRANRERLSSLGFLDLSCCWPCNPSKRFCGIRLLM